MFCLRITRFAEKNSTASLTVGALIAQWFNEVKASLAFYFGATKDRDNKSTASSHHCPLHHSLDLQQSLQVAAAGMVPRMPEGHFVDAFRGHLPDHAYRRVERIAHASAFEPEQNFSPLHLPKIRHKLPLVDPKPKLTVSTASYFGVRC
jgi:hypothetical protein